jgi:hypothetical protein
LYIMSLYWPARTDLRKPGTACNSMLWMLWILKVHPRNYKSSPLNHNLSQFSPFHILISSFFNICCNIIFPVMLVSFSWSFLWNLVIYIFV